MKTTAYLAEDALNCKVILGGTDRPILDNALPAVVKIRSINKAGAGRVFFKNKLEQEKNDILDQD